MLAKRIISRLDIKGPNLVKGIHLEGLRVLGKPDDFAQLYYQEGIDEILYQDVVASLYERNSLHELIEKTANNVFVPVTVGGGIRSIDDIRNILRAGADKVSINTAAIRTPTLIEQAAKVFGSSTIVVAIEAIKQKDGTYYAFVDNGREYTGVEVIEWAKKAEQLGAGELLITSVDNEGTGIGFDIELLTKITEKVNIPVIAHGGAGRKDDILDLFRRTNVSGVCVASLIHYYYYKKFQVEEDHLQEGNIDFIKSRKNYSKIIPTSIIEIKKYLLENNINCRM